MNFINPKALLSLLMMMLFGYISYSQVSISGKVTDAESGDDLIGVSVLVKGTVLGTITDVNGEFNLKITQAPPVTLVISSVGYERQQIEIDQSTISNLSIKMNESYMLGQEVVVSASRVEESILRSPVSIEKMDILDVQNTSSDTYYKAIANLKGVDVATSSINFQIINARGFASTGNTRFVQLIDGMDTQAPALNFPIGNLNGPSSLDVESVELIPGASSALYGPNAFNGILLINSKNPFDYQGLSATYKTGVNHIDNPNGRDPALMHDFSVRYAKSFNDKFAFKVNFSYMKADDWEANSGIDRNEALRPEGFSFNPAADRLNFMGDEASTSIGFLSFAALAAFQSEADGRNAGGANFDPNNLENAAYEGLRSIFNGAGGGVSDYLRAGDVPGHTVARSAYTEKSLIDYGAENMKINTGLFYRVNDKMELSYMYNAGFGTSIYTGAQRYALSDFGIQQHRLQLRGADFYVRAYATIEDSGNSYITEFLGNTVNESHTANSTWFARYTGQYLAYLKSQGLAPGEIGTLDPSQAIPIQEAAHQFAREQLDLTRPAEGSVPFNRFKEQALDKERGTPFTIPNGPYFADKSKMYHAEGQYNFSRLLDNIIELQAGASFRTFDLRSGGTIFPDQNGGIQINEFGGYIQAGKEVLPDQLKFSGSLRFDKNQNFNGQVNPRLSAVYTVNKNHNFRISFQTGFRNPTTQGQYIDLNIISARLLGGLEENYQKYELTTNGYTGGSVVAFRDAYFNNPAAGMASYSDLLEPVTTFDPVRPERVKSIEIGYKSLIKNKLMIDAEYYYNAYTDFITQVRIHKASGESIADPSALPSLLSSNADNTFQIYTNLDDNVTSQGAAFGLTYVLSGGYNIGANYTWSKLIGGFSDNVLSEFNTPEHKYNIKFGNRKVTKNIGFNITYRWQTDFEWQSSFAIGEVPAYSTVDAQISYKLDPLKSVLKVGGSNLLNKYYLQSLGGPDIGAIYYVSITFDELSN
ncbi:MAG: iron complex outermembrane receptor protein [Flavobacteriaceae bacterium]|jgi:iron complex outermembrane receptor protein